ncbi:MAG: 6-phosphogluconolactonase [Actinomycetota bacterium]|nr:6-phosphogluconolactonase [Actinomycetota bacterium]
MSARTAGEVSERVVRSLRVAVYPDRRAAGAAAGEHAAAVIRRALEREGRARIVLAAAQSQREMLAVLGSAPGVDWDRVTTFQMDEYAALPPGVMSLAEFLDRELFEAVRPGTVNRIEPGDEPEDECRRYEGLLRSQRIDLVCLGIGESGHLAYNDPPAARFSDSRWVRPVTISEVSRRQAVNDGHFPSLGDVPAHAVTLTIPALLSACTVVGVVPGGRRHEALRAALDGPVDESCPASALRTHRDSTLYVDTDAFEGVAAG